MDSDFRFQISNFSFIKHTLSSTNLRVKMVIINALFLEGQSIIRSPMFNGVNYVLWTELMEYFCNLLT